MKYVLKYAPEDVNIKTIFDNNWLDVEPIYRRAGWNVEYENPEYCENYSANFTFSIK